MHTEKQGQKYHSDTMYDGHNPLPSAHLGGNHHQTGRIQSKNMWHNNEHGLGRALKHHHLSHDNQIPEVRHTFLWQKETGIFTQRGGPPLNLVRGFHGTLSGQSVPLNNHDRGTMGKKRLTAVYPYPGQWPQQGHQYPHDKQSRFIHNTINISFLPHTSTRRQKTTKDEHK